MFIEVLTIHFTSDKEKYTFAKENFSLHSTDFFNKGSVSKAGLSFLSPKRWV